MAETDRRALHEAEPGSLLEGSEQALLERLARVRSVLERERAEAPSLARELLDLPATERENRLRREARFQTWGLCELLVAKSAEALEEPAKARHFAALALAGADRLNAELHAAPVVEDFKARAWALTGMACLGENDLAAAEEALRAAASCLARGTGDLLVEARLLEFEAAVRGHQGRCHEAAGLLKMAAARYREIGDTERHDRALARRHTLLQGEPGARGDPVPRGRQVSS